jgi:CheY-like chemotaxis protein
MNGIARASMSFSEMKDRSARFQASIVVIDDSESFCNLMTAASAEFNVKLTTYFSLADMYSFAKLKEFDLALIDYHLESWSGVEIAGYVEIFFSDLPVVLISADTLEMQPAWPACIKAVMSKSIGPKALLRGGLEVLYHQRFYRFLEEIAFGGQRKSPSIEEFRPPAIQE